MRTDKEVRSILKGIGKANSDRMEIEKTRVLLQSVGEYLAMIWDKELSFDDCCEPDYSGLDGEDREIAEDKFAQIEAVDVASEWLWRIIKEGK